MGKQEASYICIYHLVLYSDDLYLRAARLGHRVAQLVRVRARVRIRGLALG